MLEIKLLHKGKLSKRLLELEVFSFYDAIEFVKKLPYGRTTDRANPDLVLEELKGTCSTKHAVVKKIAIEQGIGNVKLYLCLFKMNNINTPVLRTTLRCNNLKYIPEAHCILKYKGEFIDVTNATSSYSNIRGDVLELIEIQPEQIGQFKISYHQEYLKNWLKQEDIPFSFNELWAIRECCISQLSQ